MRAGRLMRRPMTKNNTMALVVPSSLLTPTLLILGFLQVLPANCD